MPHKEVSEAIYQPADPVYGSYEGNQTASARQQYETSCEQEVREGSSGKVYPLPHDRTNLLRFALAVIALGLLRLFALLSCLSSVRHHSGQLSPLPLPLSSHH